MAAGQRLWSQGPCETPWLWMLMRILPTLSLSLLLGTLVLSGCGSSDNTGAAGQQTFPKEESDEPDAKTPEPKTPKDSPQDSKEPESKKPESGDDSEQDPGSGDDEPDEEPKFDMGVEPDPENKPKRRCDMDFLFVIDNSGSMGDIQKAIATSVPDFVKTVKERIPDLEAYHVGVISTDEGFFNAGGDVNNCARLGGLTVHTLDLARRPANITCVPYANEKNFMSNDDNLDEKFKCAAELGANGSGNERPMDALLASFSEDLTKKGSCNEDFFREDAILVVVIITDEEDDPRLAENGNPGGSKGDPADWYKALTAFKKKGPEYLVVLSLVGTPEPNACEQTFQPGTSDDGKWVKTAEIGERIIEFTEMFGKRGVVGDVCAENFDGFFQEAVNKIKLACDDIPQ